MTALHRDLPNAELHEPKGAASANANEVYVADGAGSGSWQDIIPTFGKVLEEASDESVSSTTSGTFQQKLRLSVSGLEAGDYYLFWYYELYHSNTTLVQACLAQVQVDDTAVVGSNIWSYPVYQGFSGFYPITLDTGSHTFDIDYELIGGTGIAYIRRARLLLLRAE